MGPERVFQRGVGEGDDAGVQLAHESPEAHGADREPSGVAGQAYSVRPGALGPQSRAEASPDLGREALVGVLVVHVDTFPQGRLCAAFLAPDLSRGEACIRAGCIVVRTNWSPKYSRTGGCPRPVAEAVPRARDAWSHAAGEPATRE